MTGSLQGRSGPSTCPQVRPRLVAFVKADLPALEVTLVEAHVAHCAACSDVVQVLEQGFAMADRRDSDLPGVGVGVGVDLGVGVDVGVDFRGDGPAQLAARVARSARTRRMLPLVSAAAAIVVVVGAVGWQLSSSPRSAGGVIVGVPAVPAPTAGPQSAVAAQSTAQSMEGGEASVDGDGGGLERTRPTPHLRLVAAPGWQGSVERRDDVTTEVHLRQGAVAFAFAGGQGRRLLIDTPAGAIEVVGTRFVVDVVDAGMAVSVQHGRVRLLNSGRLVEAGERVVVGAGPDSPLQGRAGSRTGAARLLSDSFLDDPVNPATTPSPTTSASRDRRSLTYVVDEIDRAEQALRAGRRGEGLAIFAALRADPAWARQRDVVDFEEARLRGLVLGDVDEARRRLRRLADRSGGVADEARLALCELDIARQPCVARACLRHVEERGGPQAQSARRLLQRSQVAERCEQGR